MDTPDENGYVEDDYRIDYLREHIKAMKDAVELDGVDLIGYTAWGPIDLVSASTGEMKNGTDLSMWIKMTTETERWRAAAKIILLV